MKERMTNFKNSIKKHVGKLVLACTGIVAMIGSAFAAEGDATPPTPPTVQDIKNLMGNVTDTFTVTFILQIMGGIIAFGIAYVLLYWAARKAVRAAFAAVKRGKIRV